MAAGYRLLARGPRRWHRAILHSFQIRVRETLSKTLGVAFEHGEINPVNAETVDFRASIRKHDGLTEINGRVRRR